MFIYTEYLSNLVVKTVFLIDSTSWDKREETKSVGKPSGIFGIAMEWRSNLRSVLSLINNPLASRDLWKGEEKVG